MPNPYSSQFAGRWIGETQGYDMPAHVWDISVHGDTVRISSRWEHEAATATMHGKMMPDKPAFTLDNFKAALIDSQHFIVPGWDTNDVRGGVGPAYDVVFSRPGLAELQAYDVWQKYIVTVKE